MRLLLLCCTLLAGCGSTSPVSLAGSYTLDTVNGQPLPFSESFTPTSPNDRYEVRSGVMVLTSGGTFTIDHATRITLPPSAPYLSSTHYGGTYTESGALALHIDGSSGILPSTVAGQSISITLGGNSYHYTR